VKVIELDVKGRVRVSDEQDVGVDPDDGLPPPVRVEWQIAVKRIDRGSMDHDHSLAVEQ
jgi:hypothetical protein